MSDRSSHRQRSDFKRNRTTAQNQFNSGRVSPLTDKNASFSEVDGERPSFGTKSLPTIKQDSPNNSLPSSRGLADSFFEDRKFDQALSSHSGRSGNSSFDSRVTTNV